MTGPHGSTLRPAEHSQTSSAPTRAALSAQQAGFPSDLHRENLGCSSLDLSVADEEGCFHRIAVTHRDPAKRELARLYNERLGPNRGLVVYK